MKKRIMALIMTSAMILGLAACGSSAASTAESAASEVESTVESVVESAASAVESAVESAAAEPGSSDSYKVALVTATQSFEFFINAERGMQDTFDANGVDFTVYNWDLNMDRQVEMLTQCQAMGYDAVICSFYDNSSGNQQMKELMDLGVKVITYESSPADETACDTSILSDDYNAGYLVGKAMAEDIGEEGKVFTYANRSLISASKRLDGFLDAISEYPGIEHVTNLEDPSSETDTNKGAALIQNVISVNPDIKGYFAAGESNCVLAAPVIEDLGLQDQIYVGSVDCTAVMKELLQAGTVDACIEQNSYNLGCTVAETTLTLLNGGTVDKVVLAPVELVTRDNIQDYL